MAAGAGAGVGLGVGAGVGDGVGVGVGSLMRGNCTGAKTRHNARGALRLGPRLLGGAVAHVLKPVDETPARFRLA